MDPLRLIIFTGVSGAGKTTALRAVEDLGFYCVDNLPLPLVADLVETMKQEPSVDRVGLVVDSRLHQHLDAYALALAALRQSGHTSEIVYLDANDEVLLRRFSQTRRRHPLSALDLPAGLTEERRLLDPLRAQATVCIDTSDLNVHQIKSVIQDRYEQEGNQLAVTLLSFGYRYGIPSHADLVFDVRFLANPFFVDELRPLTGQDAAVAQYVKQTSDAVEFIEKAEDLLQFLVPRYEAEGKVYLTVAVGCTGGRHRSVALAEELAVRLGGKGDVPVKVRHRDVER